MLDEAIQALDISQENWYIDGTFGQGGHTQEIIAKGGKVIAFDYDQHNIDQAQANFAAEIKNRQLILVRENFAYLATVAKKILTDYQIKEISGVLFDFGTTSEQLTSAHRGLSFQGEDDELDMRLDERLGVKAKDLLAIMGQKQLEKIFSVFGGERDARKISKEIVAQRRNGQFINTVEELTKLVSKVKHHHSRHIHPATKVFQALRIAVNNELENIEQALPQALEILKSQGKIVTIAFHEGEDRIAKHIFKEWEAQDLGSQEPKKVMIPSTTEVQKNPKARSAKLRGFRKK